MSSGGILAFFNDTFCTKDAVSRLVKAMGTAEEFQGAHADLVYREGNKIKRYWKMGEGNIESGWMPAHPTLFLRR